MSTKIDTLSIEIQTSSAGAAQGIDNLASSLAKLKSNGSIGVAVKNLERLTTALKGMSSAASNAKTLGLLADSVDRLSQAGSITRAVNQITKLAPALDGLSRVTIDATLYKKVEALGSAMRSLSSVKAGGIGTIASALTKLQNIDLDSIQFDDAKIARFVAEIKKLDDAIGPLSTKLVSVGSAFKAVNSGVGSMTNKFSIFGSKVNITTLNLSSLVTVAQGFRAVMQPIVSLISNAIKQSMEWDGVMARFGRTFGESAQSTYEWIQRLNEEMGINTQEFMQNSSLYAQMLTGFGVAVEDARTMAVGYTELTYDIWASTNDVYKTFEEATDAVRSAIAGEVEPIRRAGMTITESTLKQTAANHGLEISLANATEAQKSYLRYLTLVDQAHSTGTIGTYAREMNTAEGLVRTFTQQLKSLAQAFGSLFLPILTKVMPWLQAFVELLTEAIHRVAAFFGIEIQPVSWGNGLSGAAESVDNVTDSLGDASDAAGNTTKALKELKNATLGIDELNVISPPDPASGSSGSGGSGGSGGAGGGFGDLDVGSLWTDSIFDQIQFEVDEIQAKLKEALSSITAVISGFMLAIGTILVVSGANIPLGLGLMAVGAVGLVATVVENWDGMSTQIAKTLTTVTAVLGGFLLAIGAFLAFSGVNVGLGAALMVAGAVSLGTAATINWKFLNGDMDNAISILTGIVSGGLLAMGALFTFTGAGVGLGIGLMLAGAVGLATTVGLNWNAMTEPMRKAIGTLEMIVGTALLSFGAILAFSGVNIPLGIGLIAAGAVSLVAAERLNWDSLHGTMKERIATLATLLGGGLLGIGAVLAFSGVATPLGIALMAAGAVGIIAAAPVNWSSLVEKIGVVLKEIGIAVGASLLAVGAILAFSGVALPLGIALIAAGAVSLVSGVALNWGTIVSGVKNGLKEIGIIAGTSMLALGLILCLSGVGIPLGLALIAAGAVGLASGVALNWDSITTKVKQTVSDIGKAWDGLWESTKTGIKRMWDGVVGWFTDLWDTLVGHSIVPDTIDGIVDCFLGLPGRVLSSVSGFVKNIVAKFGEFKVVQVAVSLVKKGWSTIKGWIGAIPGVDQAVKLIKSGWSTVRGWIGSIPTLSQSIQLIKSGWSSVKKWIGSIPKLSQSIGLVKSGWSSVSKWVGSMPTLKAKIGLIKSGWTSIKSWLGDLNYKLSFKLPKIGVNWGTKEVLGFKISYPSGFYTYAKGGFPDIGEMFVAREAGPEMVGRIGNKTTVANNDQIIEGISEGVYAAVLAAMRASDSNGSQAVNVYLDGRQLTSTVEQRQRERGASIMGSQVYSY